MLISIEKDSAAWILLYDAECSLCTRFARFIEEFDRAKQIEIVSLQEHFLLNESIPLEELMKEVHLLGENNLIFRGEEAVGKIISLVPQAKPLRWMVESRWGQKSASLAYRTAKRLRRKSCCG
ncbi:MAG: DUF393 domain-containing protein [bacterium]|nr:DUF393 domain-containing protein [bacterium]